MLRAPHRCKGYVLSSHSYPCPGVSVPHGVAPAPPPLASLPPTGVGPAGAGAGGAPRGQPDHCLVAGAPERAQGAPGGAAGGHVGVGERWPDGQGREGKEGKGRKEGRCRKMRKGEGAGSGKGVVAWLTGLASRVQGRAGAFGQGAHDALEVARGGRQGSSQGLPKALGSCGLPPLTDGDTHTRPWA